MRKIVVLRPHEPLRDSFLQQKYIAAASFLESAIKTLGMNFVEEPAVRIPVISADRMLTLVEGVYSTPLGHNYALSAEFDDEDAEARFVREKNDEIEGVYSDPEISPFPTTCPGSAVGNKNDVERQINIAPVHAAGHRGQGVRIAVVDTGIYGQQINVAGGLNRPGLPAPGTAVPDHGTMVAFDAQIAAPNAMIYDYPLLKSTGGVWVGFLSDGIRIYAELLNLILNLPGPLVVVNSWGMYNRTQDRPVGDPQNYSTNPKHPFNLIVGSLVSAGADVFFAAGNCGTTCPDTRCGSGDRGPGNSIHGANSHPDVVTVAAVTTSGDLLGYSSQGPGSLHAQKPDLAASSHFTGSGVGGRPDSGTSAACPVAAGVAAALRSKPSARALSPAQLKSALLNTSSQPSGTSPGWNGDIGWGILDAGRAYSAV